MAAPFLIAGRLSKQRLRLESAFGIARRTPSLVNFSTKAGGPKKPVRYTSIKKAKPKTVIDIGKLLLQRTNDAKVNKQSVIADAALKAATQTAKPAALKQSTATSKAPVAASSTDVESVPPVTTNAEHLEATRFVLNATPKVSDAVTGLTVSSPSVKDEYEDTRSVDQGTVPENVGQETKATKNVTPEAFSSSELSPPLGTSLEVSTGAMSESTTVPDNDLDKRVSITKATLEPSAVPIDVTYSEDVHVTDGEAASTEPSVGVLPTTDTVVAETVGPQSVSAIGVPAAPAGFCSTRATPPAEEIACALQGTAFTSSSEVAPSGVEVMQDGRPLTPETLAFSTSCSEIVFEGEAVGHVLSSNVEPVQETAVTESEFSRMLPYEDTTVQNVDTKEIQSSSKGDLEKAVLSDSISGVMPITNQHTTNEIHWDSPSRAEEKDTMKEKVPNLTPETSMAQCPDPPNGEFAEEEIKMEGEEAVKKSADGRHTVQSHFRKRSFVKNSRAVQVTTQLDPIQRLFLDKIREYSTKSKDRDRPVDAGSEYEKAFSEELTKLQRLYGNGDLTSFPEFKFPEPVLDESAPDK